MSNPSLLPQSEEAEKGVLSAFMLSPREVGAICAAKKVEPAAFHIPAHATIYAAQMALWRDGNNPSDFITLAHYLRDKGFLEAVGGVAAITQLCTFLPSAINVEHYIAILQEQFSRREVIRVCGEFSERAKADDNAGKMVSQFATSANSLIAPNRAAGKSMKEMAMDKLHRMQADEVSTRVIATGIKKLDELSPLTRGAMPLISGEKKSGKSILSLTIAANIATDGGRVLYFSLEDPAYRVVDRLWAGRSRIPIVKHSQRWMSEGEFGKQPGVASWLATLPMNIRDDVYERGEIVAVVRQYKAQFPDLVAVFVDYAQLVKSYVSKSASRQDEIEATSRDFRLLAMELDVAMVVLCQLNKEGNTRGSTALEKDCTAMWQIVTPGENDPQEERLVSIPYQRDGESSIAFKTTFLGHLARFENYAGE